MKREYPDQPVVSVAGVVVEPAGRVLLVRRGKQPSMGVWSIPGGAVELGETLSEALAREVLEETSVIARPLELLTFVERILRDPVGRIQFHYVIAEFVARWESGDPSPADDVDRAEWAHPEDMERYSLPEYTRKIIRQGLERFESVVPTKII